MAGARDRIDRGINDPLALTAIFLALLAGLLFGYGASDARRKEMADECDFCGWATRSAGG